ncbi:MAG: tyrosine-type recombinase/integrase [Planctomycetes bacterium]|nr:tyrosine-type recombinase/integrase [Planctomycetota bacterium]
MFVDGRGRKQTYPLAEDDPGKMLVERPCWYFDFTGPDGKTRTEKGYTDKKSTEQLAEQRELEAARQRDGLPVADRQKNRTVFAEVVSAYAADLERKGRATKYVKNCKNRLTLLGEECHWPTIGTMRGEALTAWLGMSSQRERAPRTINQFIETARTFAEWCVDNDYLAGNPFTRVQKSSDNDPKRVRRAFTLDEINRLLDHAPTGRRLVYLTALLTGLRRKELKRLCWGSVDLEGRCIRLKAKDTKAKRPDVLPLHPQLVEALAAARPECVHPATPVFPHVPKFDTWTRDLAGAGIPYLDPQGRMAGFHSLRVTYCTLLGRAGVSVRDTMQLMRHTSERLTLEIYTDYNLLDVSGSVAQLPNLGTRTGTG